MNFFAITIGLIVAISFLLVAAAVYRKIASDRKIKLAEEEAKKIIERAQSSASETAKAAESKNREFQEQSKDRIEKELQRRKQEWRDIERRIEKKEAQLDQRGAILEEKVRDVEEERKRLQEKQHKLDSMYQQQIEALERVSQLGRDEARSQILTRVEAETKDMAAKMIRETEAKAKQTADRRVREILTIALQKCTVDQALQVTTTTVELPGDEYKGKIIGREGRNIRAFEAATGVDLIVDDTPGVVILSCFDPIRREIGRLALKHLIDDGRIHPARVEESVTKARKEVEDVIREKGEETILELDIGTMHPKLVYLVGKLHYRTSYGQNILAHSKEIAHLCGIMAGELGANVRLAKRSGLLHDIGKALDFEQEGTHTRLGVEICNKCGEVPEIANAILVHHDEAEPFCVESIIVKVADGMSGARPGARRESVDAYIKRLQKLEEIVKEFPGVEGCYAIQAGREVRVIVKPEEVDDATAVKLSHDISKRIEGELDYPGEIQVSVIRETRAVAYAR